MTPKIVRLLSYNKRRRAVKDYMKMDIMCQISEYRKNEKYR